MRHIAARMHEGRFERLDASGAVTSMPAVRYEHVQAWLEALVAAGTTRLLYGEAFLDRGKAEPLSAFCTRGLAHVYAPEGENQ